MFFFGGTGTTSTLSIVSKWLTPVNSPRDLRLNEHSIGSQNFTFGDISAFFHVIPFKVRNRGIE
jgi:hypothetical protein